MSPRKKGKKQKEQSPRRNDRRTEEAILRAAERLFGRHGFTSTTVHDIAKEAGINSALIFYYFESKEKLYILLVERQQERLIGKLCRVLEGEGSAKERLGAFISLSSKLVLTHVNVHKILMREALGFGEEHNLPLKRYFEDILSPIEKVIREGVKAKEFRAVDPGIAALSLVGILRAFFTQKLIMGRTYGREVINAAVLDLFLKGIQS
jgi:TetR/AcrR family transcriptional regulator